jgi:hypothetical protein
MGRPSKKNGRPTKLSDERIEQAGILCRKGFTNLELAEFFKVDEKTIYNWQDKNPSFFQALKENKDLHDDEVEASLAKSAKGFMRTVEKIDRFGGVIAVQEEVPPNPTSLIFWLKNRRPEKWRDKQEIEHSGEVKTAVLELASGTGKPRKD